MKWLWRIVGRKIHKHCPELFKVSYSLSEIQIGENCHGIVFQVNTHHGETIEKFKLDNSRESEDDIVQWYKEGFNDELLDKTDRESPSYILDMAYATGRIQAVFAKGSDEYQDLTRDEIINEVNQAVEQKNK